MDQGNNKTLSQEDRKKILEEAQKIDAMPLEKRLKYLAKVIKAMEKQALVFEFLGNLSANLAYNAGASGMAMALSICKGTFAEETEEAIDQVENDPKTTKKHPFTLVRGDNEVN